MSSNKDSGQHDSIGHRAAHLAMFTGAVAGVQQTTAIAQDPTAEGTPEIVVTGSRIRRIEAETVNPVQIVTAEAIAESGVVTMGELLQKLPSIGGAASTPARNNGGGEGASSIELRGLGEERTLVLINGHRFGALGRLSSAVDVNAIPINMIERVEVLKQGAGAIYGSDAIGGVVNFITKKEMDGAELSLDGGTSSESDGDRKGVSLTYGTSNDTTNLILGMNYNKQDEVSSGEREFSRNAIYFYGSVFEGGSSRTPTGRMFFDTPSATAAGLPAQYLGCAGTQGVTRSAGAVGDDLADYRCYESTGTPNDSYNYQPLNLNLTPQERASIFVLGSHKINDDVEVYTEFLYNRTKSGYQIAPLPFDSRSDNTVISAANIYNPFGIDFGGTEDTYIDDMGTPDPLDDVERLSNPNATFRLEGVGNRSNKVRTWQGDILGGLRGSLFDTGWNWDASIGYSRIDQDRSFSGYLFKSSFENSLGPSFLDDNGTPGDPTDDMPTCGVPGAPISGCVPLNIFNLTDPDAAQLAALRSITGSYTDRYESYTQSATLALDGEVFDLPAGAVEAAVGFQYADRSGTFDTAFITEASAPLYKDCLVSGEACSGDSDGSYDVKELYGELLVPILKDAQFAQSLNLTVGLRYSDYSNFGDTTNASFKVDWRPTDELMVRASYADIFRAPTIIDLFQAPTADAATFTDPCVGLTAAAVAANPNLDPNAENTACENVPLDGEFAQPNAQVDGLLRGNTELDPEEGDALTFGVVYEPEFVRGLSLSIDYWDYSIDDVITQVDVNTSAEQCVATGSPQFCGYINRFGDGTILQIQEPTINLGKLDTSGIDFSVAYMLPGTGFGDFRFGLDATYTADYDSTIPGSPVVEVAGTYDRQYGNIADWRLMGNVGWAYSDFSAQVVVRWIDSVSLTDPDGSPFVCAGGTDAEGTRPECVDALGDGILGPSPDLDIASQIYWDMTAGYTLPSTDTKFQLGINNMFDNQPPILYQNNVTNANTDVETYDTIGRYFFASISQKF